jgi:hypothetical protein
MPPGCSPSLLEYTVRSVRPTTGAATQLATRRARRSSSRRASMCLRTAVCAVLLCTSYCCILSTQLATNAARRSSSRRAYTQTSIYVSSYCCICHAAVYLVLLYTLAMRATLRSLPHTAVYARHARYSSCCISHPAVYL